MSSPEGFLAEALKIFEQIRPILPLYAHLILSALFPIVTGSYASLSRPSSAAKPAKKPKSKRSAAEDDEEEEIVQKMEGLSPRDAIMFPVMAGTVLAGLYWLIKRYGADAINLVLGWYFSFAGLLSVSKSFNDVAVLGLGLVFPTFSAKRGRVWRLDDREEKVKTVEGEGEAGKSPLPGWLNGFALPSSVTQFLWFLRTMPKQKYDFATNLRHVLDIQFSFTLVNALAALAGLGAISYNHFIAKPWWLTNVQGFAVSYSTLQFMSPTTFATGSLILSGLFFYDIWAVFFTPLMVTVATNLDQPIKLLFPRPDEPAVEGKPPPSKSYSMLGLGDIVLPGLMVGLALRFDLHMYYLRKQQKQSRKASDSGESKEDVIKAEYTTATGQWGSRLWTLGVPASALPAPVKAAAFPKPYFTASLIGYVIGMLATLGVMSIWQHAQPALLYLVPGVIISLWSTALVRGEVKKMWNYSELSEAEDEEKKKRMEEEEEKEQEEKSKPRGEESEGLYASIKRWLSGPSEDSSTAAKQKDEKEKKEKSEASKADKKEESGKKPTEVKPEDDPDHVFSFSIRRHDPSRKFDAKGGAESESSSGTDTNTSPGSKNAELKDGNDSGSGSEDAILVSNDSEAVASGGPARRTRGNGSAANTRRM